MQLKNKKWGAATRYVCTHTTGMNTVQECTIILSARIILSCVSKKSVEVIVGTFKVKEHLPRLFLGELVTGPHAVEGV